MTNHTFEYQGHMVTVSAQEREGKVQYWFIVDGRPISHVSREDTAKRLATKFIDVIVDEHYGTSRQGVTREYLV